MARMFASGSISSGTSMPGTFVIKVCRPWQRAKASRNRPLIPPTPADITAPLAAGPRTDSRSLAVPSLCSPGHYTQKL